LSSTIFLPESAVVCAMFGSGAGLYDGAPHIVHLDTASLLQPDALGGGVFAVEFFAPWCGHCQAFSPTWKAVARASCAAAPALRVGVVDCVANAKLCARYQVQSYPSIRLFSARAPVLGQPLPRCPHGCRTTSQVLDDIIRSAAITAAVAPPLEMPSSANALIERSERVGCSRSELQLNLPSVHSGAVRLQPGEPPAEFWIRPRPMEDVTSAVVYGLRREVFTRPLAHGSGRRAALSAWLSLLAEALPGRRNREVIAWVREHALPASTELEQWERVLDTSPASWLSKPSVEWRSCRGYSATARGYPCALWTLFHTLLAHTADPPGALLAIQGYVEHFFGWCAPVTFAERARLRTPCAPFALPVRSCLHDTVLRLARQRCMRFALLGHGDKRGGYSREEWHRRRERFADSSTRWASPPRCSKQW
jgi:thiol-disulfide isomerase/thioredoxin